MKCFEFGKTERDIITEALKTRHKELDKKIEETKSMGQPNLTVELIILQEMVDNLLEQFGLVKK